MTANERAGADARERGPREPFVALEQEHEAVSLGMWTFLATELLLFGGLFLGYTVYRLAYPQAIAAGAERLDAVLGTINTAVLLTSSMTMALAVRAARLERRGAAIRLALATAALGTAFLAIKAHEYMTDYEKGLVPSLRFTLPSPMRGEEMFYTLYFLMTGLHALHLAIAVGVVLWVAWRLRRAPRPLAHDGPLEATGLYWHFVDLVWVFLFPLFYLVGRS